jgi:hypothetical protein
MTEILGNGIIVAEGADHRRQRRLMSPSFGLPAVKGMMSIFYDKSFELKDKLASMIDDDVSEYSSTPTAAIDRVPGGKKIDVMRYLGQATLDIIGVAGFDYDFKSLGAERSPLAEAFRDLFQAGQNLNFMAILQAFVPGFKYIVSRRT